MKASFSKGRFISRFKAFCLTELDGILRHRARLYYSANGLPTNVKVEVMSGHERRLQRKLVFHHSPTTPGIPPPANRITDQGALHRSLP